MLRELIDFVPAQVVEAVIVAFCAVLLGAYHLVLLRRLRTQPTSTAMGRHRVARAAWVKLERGGPRELVVVQAMRNLIMSASFLASTAVLLAAGILGGAFTTDKLSEFANALNFLGVETHRLWLFKLLLLTVNFLAAFFNFSLAMRSFGHVGLMSSLPGEEGAKTGSDSVADELERGARHYALGMRGFYVSIPLMLWLFGPIWMLVGTVLLIVVLRRVD